MKLNIRLKLFIAILSAQIAVYIAMYSMTRYSFDRGFLEYISRIEEQQVPALVEELSDFYTQFGSWEPLIQDFRVWRQLVYNSISVADGPAPDAPRARFSATDWYLSSEYSPQQPYLLLLDAEKNTIICGNCSRDALDLANLYEVRSRGELTGYLGVISRQALSEQADREFSEEQKNNLLTYVAVLVVMSALIAFPLASLMVRPIRELVAGARALTSGDYSSRIKARTSDELGVLAMDFNTLAHTLEQNRKVRQQWIADISHELRTPLAVLRGELESMQDGIRPLTPQALDSLHHEIVHLNSLVNDLHELSLSDMGALVYEKQNFDLEELLDTSLGLFRNTMEKESISSAMNLHPLNPGRPIVLCGDEKRFMQLFSNLLQNTCRYTEKGGKLQIEVHETGEYVSIDFSDSGPGVRDEDLPRLFDRLFRIEGSRNREQGGSGLGLAICKNIVEAHGGRISAAHSTMGGLSILMKFPPAVPVSDR